MSACLRGELVVGAGFLAGLVPALVHGLLTAPGRYLEAVLYYRIAQNSVVSDSLGLQLSLFAHNTLFIVVHLPILLLAVVGLGLRRGEANPNGRALLWLWTATSLGGVALGGSWFPHYYEQILPPLSVAVALTLRGILHRSRHLAQAALQGMAAPCVLSLGLTLGSIIASPADPEKLTLNSFWPSLPAAGTIAAYLRDHTTPDDAIYVAYQRAEIYYLAQRRPAARWLYFYELSLTPGAFDEQVSRLATPTTAPRYIIRAQPFDAFGLDANGALRAVVARDYTLETTIEGVPLYRHN